jgi:hypothetical protein
MAAEAVPHCEEGIKVTLTNTFFEFAAVVVGELPLLPHGQQRRPNLSTEPMQDLGRLASSLAVSLS